MNPIENVLRRLESVRQRQTGQWSARCPAHDDRGPSLSIRETPDGAVLMHCFAGCEAGAIAATIGIELSDLFPPRVSAGHEPRRTASALTAGQALEVLSDEATLIAMEGTRIGKGFVPTSADLERIRRAAGRINHIRGAFL
jgi:hypothetical protein